MLAILQQGKEECRAETIVVHCLSSTHLPPLPSSVQPVAPPLPATFAMHLCQRTQGCMKNENHTGFCSGHRGFKRKNTAATGEEGATGSARRKGGGKGKGPGGAVAGQSLWSTHFDTFTVSHSLSHKTLLCICLSSLAGLVQAS
jgi:hypothetical protein